MAKNVKKSGGMINTLKAHSYIVIADGFGLLTLVKLVQSPIISKLATLPLICTMVFATFIALAPSHATTDKNSPTKPRRPSEHWTAIVPCPTEWQSYKDG